MVFVEGAMTITYETSHEGRVLIFHCTDPFTVLNLVETTELCQREVFDKVSKKVYVISDLSGVTRIPPDLLNAGHRLFKKPHPMTGPVFEVTTNELLFRLVTVISKITPSGTVTVRKTLAEALEEVERLIALEASEPATASQVNAAI